MLANNMPLRLQYALKTNFDKLVRLPRRLQAFIRRHRQGGGKPKPQDTSSTGRDRIDPCEENQYVAPTPQHHVATAQLRHTHTSEVEETGLDVSPPSEYRILPVETWSHPYYGIAPLADVSTPYQPTGDSELQSHLAQRRRELQHELSSLNALHNVTVTINKLPNELLAEIMVYVHAAEWTWLNMIAWISVLCVCRHWFAVAAATPQLWCSLVAQSSTEYLCTGLARSKSMPVSIQIGRLVWSIAELQANTVSRALRLMIPHLHHIRSITLEEIPQALSPEVAALFRHPMLVLSSLNIRLKGAHLDPNPPVLTLAPEHYPALQELRLHGIQMLHTHVLRQLRVLHLSEWPVINPPLTLRLLTAILEDLVNVESLKLAGVGCVEDSQPRHLHQIFLPRLTTLSIRRCPIHVTKHIYPLRSFYSVILQRENPASASIHVGHGGSRTGRPGGRPRPPAGRQNRSPDQIPTHRSSRQCIETHTHTHTHTHDSRRILFNSRGNERPCSLPL
ncbi:hypothetical protein BV20DRAFT_1076179 [Pilatotrama ljubarskyi]|nr:hypothetical protein BV20DRAFT_1076179 [Pilatotrama ljubarskyi]